MTSELIAVLEKEASAECERILGEARTQAAEIVAQAQREAQSYLEAQRRQAEAERAATRTKSESAAQLKAAALVLQAKDQGMTAIFTDAEVELGRFSQNKTQYAKILRGLIQEGAAGLSGHLIIEVYSNDLQVARQTVKEAGLDAEVKSSTAVSGGARVATPDGRFVVENTLTSRLERIKPVVASEVAALLWR